jgi:hypothetical protein
MADGFGDAFDEVSESDEAPDAVKGDTLSNVEEYGVRIADAAAGAANPISAEWRTFDDALTKSNELSGKRDPVEMGYEGLDRVTHEKAADLWEEMEPKGQSSDLDFFTDRTGTAAIESIQMGGKIIDSMNPASTWWPAAQAVRDEWPEAQKAMTGDPDHGIPYKNPEIPDTDAVVGGDVSDHVVAAPEVEDMIAPTDASSDASTPDPAAYDAPSYDTPSIDTASYDTPSVDASTYDPSSDAGGAFGSTSDDSGSSFTDF